MNPRPYSAILWLIDHADDLGVDSGRIAVMGDSGGGTPAAGATILARDHNVAIAKQILIYPMLDDRQPSHDPALEPFLTWPYDDNFTSWNAALGEACGTDDVAPTAAPARCPSPGGRHDSTTPTTSPGGRRRV